jgi:hypothetical protein
MTDCEPVACSLGAVALEERLRAVAVLGDEALISSEEADGRHLLRFRDAAGVDARLEALVEAEVRCCPFLELELRRQGEQLLLSIGASAEGRATAAELAAAFGG